MVMIPQSDTISAIALRGRNVGGGVSGNGLKAGDAQSIQKACRTKVPGSTTGIILLSPAKRAIRGRLAARVTDERGRWGGENM
jgi:hypothetical protein